MQCNSGFIRLVLVYLVLLACGARSADYIQLHSVFPPMLQNYWENGLIFWSFGLGTVVTDNYVRLTTNDADSCGYLWNRHVNRMDDFELNATIQLRKREASWIHAPGAGGGLGIWYASDNFTVRSDTSLFGFKRSFDGVGVVLTHADELVFLANDKTVQINPERIALPGGKRSAGRCLVPSLGELHLTITLRYVDGVFGVFYVYHEDSEPRPEDYARAVPCTSTRVRLPEGRYRFGVTAKNSETSQATHEVHSVIMSPIGNRTAHEAEEREAERVHLFNDDDKKSKERLVGKT